MGEVDYCKGDFGVLEFRREVKWGMGSICLG